MKHKTGEEFTEPPGYPNLSGFQLIELFTAVLTTEKKEEVLQSFVRGDGKVRLLIVTTAFGMGIDCPDIRKIIYWGVTNTLEEYVEQTGQCRRDGQPSVAMLY